MSGAHVAAFYQQVAVHELVYIALDANRAPLYLASKSGRPLFPIWSSRSRLEKVFKYQPALMSGFSIVEFSWSQYLTSVVPVLKSDHALVAINLSGKHLTGFEFESEQVERQVNSHRMESFC